ncbi:transcriptional regulator, TetR family [Collimonas sp. OK607]|uniref:TetR/AcrR family transcriptional regulator n=1 Tax=Collimonas sp. OK607 TaxID=1798194 RepID=UPI0008EED26E|nr:TetR/AcrR family transcriptional regulator [Collimonas sp. OK607]SFB08132.1 transcriptional regulator, TetR family [Collimonas sp. OK607]
MRVKSEERRQAILDTAEQMFNEVGFDRTSMSEMSARLGGSKATLYNYFSSKEEIFVEVMRRQAGAQFEMTFGSLAESDDLPATLQRFGMLYLQTVLRPEIIAARRLVLYHAERTKLGQMMYERGPKMGWTMVAEFLKTAMARKQMREADAWLAALQLRGLLEAEWMEVRMLGVVTNVPATKLRDSVERAVDAFMRLYAP